jgi:hypothetical protein
MFEIDSLRYHLPLAATFAQQHSISALHYLELDHLATTAPSNSELLGAVAITTAGNDVAVPLLSVFWAGLGLLAGWCLGRRAGVAAAVTAAVAVTMLVPLSAVTAPGSAKNDVAVVALLTAALALTPRDLTDRRSWFAAAAAGLAIATKLTAVVPVGVLAVVVVVVNRKRWRALVVPGGVLVAAGAYWYARNVAATGSPVPASDLALGPVHLSAAPDPALERFGYTIVDRIDDGSFVRSLPHIFHLALGPGWWLIVGSSVAGIAWALLRGSFLARLVAAVALASLAVYVVTPYSAGGTLDSAWLTAPDVRFAFPGFALGLAALAMMPTTRRGTAAVDATIGAALVSTLFSAIGPWRTIPTEFRRSGLFVLVLCVAAGIVLLRAKSPGRVLACGAAIAAVVVLVAGFWVQRRYFDDRYVARSPTNHTAVDRWAHDVAGRRIATVGISMSYPLYGTEQTNQVDYLGVDHGDGSFTSLPDCHALLRAIDDGGYDFVVAGPFKTGLENAPEREWLHTDDRAKSLFVDGGVEVFEITGSLRADNCDGTTATLVSYPYSPR